MESPPSAPLNPHLRAMTASPIRPIRRPPLPALTGVRFFAAVQVVFFHYGSGFARRHHFAEPVSRLLANGWTSVSLFFLLSGFILSYTYDRQIVGSRNRRHFWEARLARLYPVYLVALAIMVPFAFSSHYLNAVRSIWQLFSVLFMVQAWNPHLPGLAQIWNAPAWTLSVESFFYIVFPFVLPMLEKLSVRSLRGTAAGLLLLITLTHSMAFGGPAITPVGPVSSIPMPIAHLPEFLLGASMGLLFLRSGPIRHPGYFVTGSLLAIAAIETTVSGPWISLLAIPFAVLLYSLAAGRNLWARILSSGILVLLGGASYSLYLLQVPVRLWTDRCLSALHLADALEASISLALLICLSILVFLYWEEPARKLIRRLFSSARIFRRSSPADHLSRNDAS